MTEVMQRTRFLWRPRALCLYLLTAASILLPRRDPFKILAPSLDNFNWGCYQRIQHQSHVLFSIPILERPQNLSEFNWKSEHKSGINNAASIWSKHFQHQCRWPTNLKTFLFAFLAFLHTNFSISEHHDFSWISGQFYCFARSRDMPSMPRGVTLPYLQRCACSLNFPMLWTPTQHSVLGHSWSA